MDINTLFDVKGKVVLVTGGAKGIGKMISTGFVSNGAKVYLSSRDAAACTSAAASLSSLPAAKASGGSAHALPANLQDLAECERLIAALKTKEPKLHVLVNNAGAAWGAPLDSYPDAAWTKLLTLNLQRAFTLTQLALPLLEAAGTPTQPAAVIHIGSVDGLRVPVQSTFAYSAAKAGLHHLSRHLAAHLGSRHVTSNTLACGPFDTKMMAVPLKNFRDAIEETVPVGRIGTPEDVAAACLFLASRGGAFINGATIAVDGGLSLVTKL